MGFSSIEHIVMGMLLMLCDSIVSTITVDDEQVEVVIVPPPSKTLNNRFCVLTVSAENIEGAVIPEANKLLL